MRSIRRRRRGRGEAIEIGGLGKGGGNKEVREKEGGLDNEVTGRGRGQGRGRGRSHRGRTTIEAIGSIVQGMANMEDQRLWRSCRKRRRGGGTSPRGTRRTNRIP